MVLFNSFLHCTPETVHDQVPRLILLDSSVSYIKRTATELRPSHRTLQLKPQVQILIPQAGKRLKHKCNLDGFIQGVSLGPGISFCLFQRNAEHSEFTRVGAHTGAGTMDDFKPQRPVTLRPRRIPASAATGHRTAGRATGPGWRAQTFVLGRLGFVDGLGTRNHGRSTLLGSESQRVISKL